MEVNTLANINGMSKIKAIELLAAIELGKRVYTNDNYSDLVYLTDPSSIINYFHENLSTMMETELRVLNRRGKYGWLRFILCYIFG